MAFEVAAGAVVVLGGSGVGMTQHSDEQGSLTSME